MTLLAEQDHEDRDRLLVEYREARDEEDDAASRAASAADELRERFGIDAETER